MIVSTEERERIIQLENMALSELALTRQKVILGESKEYNKRIKELIKEHLGYDISYYYKGINLKLMSNNYVQQSTDTIEMLSKKYVITVALTMLKVKIPTGEETVSNEYTMEQLIIDTMELVNRFFVYMNPRTWESYWDDFDKLDSYNKGAVFWTQYLLTKNYKDIQETVLRAKKETDDKAECELYRNKVREGLGEEYFKEIEEVLPEIDWKLIFSESSKERDEYARRCAVAMESFYDIGYMNWYSKEQEIVRAYQFYYARGIMNGVPEEKLAPYDRYKEVYKKNREEN